MHTSNNANSLISDKFKENRVLCKVTRKSTGFIIKFILPFHFYSNTFNENEVLACQREKRSFEDKTNALSTKYCMSCVIA